MQLTILIPCKDERDALAPLGKALAELPRIMGADTQLEAVFVDDGSTDGTGEALDGLANALPFPVRVCRHPINRGIGAALRTAAPGLSGDTVVTYDADRPYPLADLPQLVGPIEDGTADVVSASPWRRDGSSEGLPPGRIALSRLVSSLYRLRLGKRAAGLRTITSGYRAWRRETFIQCLPSHDGFSATAQMLLAALRSGARATERPSTLRVRTEGTSKMRVLRTALAHLSLLLRG